MSESEGKKWPREVPRPACGFRAEICLEFALLGCRLDDLRRVR